MLGGGTFTVQNKKLPGAYINFVSAQKASATLSDRGIAALPIVWDWGIDGEVFGVGVSDFLKDTKKIFGYDYTSEKVKGLRDLFLGAKTVYFYKLNNGSKASNTFATAKYKGTRGNDIKTVISINVDDQTKFDVATYLDLALVDSQTVSNAKELVDNDYIDFKKDAALVATAGANLTGGTNGEITGSDYQAALNAFEAYSFNALGCLATNEEIKGLFVAYTKRLREDAGVKFQCVVHRYETADYEGIVSVENNTTSELVYWVLGRIAGCGINASNTNKEYTGEFVVDTGYTQSQLEEAIDGGKFILHRSGDKVRVLEDINTLVTTTEEKGADFKSNQTIRVLDQIGNDIAALFNTNYLGIVPNDNAGRISLWNDIVKHHQELQKVRAIENFSSENVTVKMGDTKKSVVVSDYVTPTNCMAQLYMVVTVM